ncbi:hypothetical protein [Magnetospirillum gryphiswaldense]|uniref:Uncharacterized protein n=1 Tax=Magnetospirillum gryphiswaldense TaxID=55518 RepID=A4TZH7_9PROT|nr:hypothetical protein [Magnetospirillum gryphiswaldense]AVM74310.1 hypothetical protein MSR1_18180 [Magnetospirillum gryphiswaldense MSR-1]AVM78213.1 hypothetical protein MSR1L_18180 [Magnetospirillum gryphiswaldense]CAM76034.1 hypothetical protein MGR_1500 [Magnetospirillum gryphiswaldense MSR-1]
MTASVESLMQAAAAQVNAGNLGGAWNLYLAAIQAEPGNAQAWLGLGMTALLQRNWELLVQVADRRQQLGGDGFAYFHDVLTVISGYGFYELLEAMATHLPDTSTYAPSSLYYAVCARLLDSDEDAAFALLARLKPLLAERRDHLPIGPGDRFNIAYRQASLVEDGDYPDRLDDNRLSALAAALPAVETYGQWHQEAGGDFVLLAACDGQYLNRFGADYLKSLMPLGQGAMVHLHVIEPVAEGLAPVAALAAAAAMPVTITCEPASAWRGGAYFASARFLAAPWVVERHCGRPVMITDIDVRFLRPPAELAEAARPYAFASFVHDGVGPASRLPAVWTWFAGDHGQSMLRALSRSILSKLDIPWPHNWMLDQAALMTARRWLRRHHPQVALAEMNSLLGQSFTPWLECRGDEDDKAALIRQAGQGE